MLHISVLFDFSLLYLYIKVTIMSTYKTFPERAQVLIDAFTKAYKEHPDTVGTVIFEYEDDIRNAKPGKVVTQYGDFFVIMPPRITNIELPILDILLSKPFDGVLYQSNFDHQLQIRISAYNIENKL